MSDLTKSFHQSIGDYGHPEDDVRYWSASKKRWVPYEELESAPRLDADLESAAPFSTEVTETSVGTEGSDPTTPQLAA